MNITSQDFLFYSLGIGFLILVGFLSLAAFRMSQSLKTLNQILSDVENISDDIDKLSRLIKLGISSAVRMFPKKGKIK